MFWCFDDHVVNYDFEDNIWILLRLDSYGVLMEAATYELALVFQISTALSVLLRY